VRLRRARLPHRTAAHVALTPRLFAHSYFDHRRQTDASFRKALKRERRRAARQNDAAAGAREKDTARAVEQAVRDVLAPGALPAGSEAREAW